MKKKGFTLIELLAVIIILGILMLIAVPSVTAYINNSRKNAYAETIQGIVKGAVNKINDGSLEVYDTDTTYYIPASAIELESGTLQSPYGKINTAYVVVTYDGDNYDYYYVGKDEKDMGIDKITKGELINKESIVSDIGTIDTTVGIIGKGKIIVFDESLTPGTAQTASTNVYGEYKDNAIEYPEGKNKETVVVGDIVKIDTEEFYVVKHDGDDLVLLAKYNLKVGAISNYDWETLDRYDANTPGYGLQSAEAKGLTVWDTGYTYYGTTIFASNDYWRGKLGTTYTGTICEEGEPYTPGTKCMDVYDINSDLYPYVNNYLSYLSKKGAYIKEARLLRYEEAYELGCRSLDSISKWNCFDAPAWVYSSTYWLSTIDSYVYSGDPGPGGIYVIDMSGYFYTDYYSDFDGYGLRPVIVI